VAREKAIDPMAPDGLLVARLDKDSLSECDDLATAWVTACGLFVENLVDEESLVRWREPLSAYFRPFLRG